MIAIDYRILPAFVVIVMTGLFTGCASLPVSSISDANLDKANALERIDDSLKLTYRRIESNGKPVKDFIASDDSSWPAFIITNVVTTAYNNGYYSSTTTQQQMKYIRPRFQDIDQIEVVPAGGMEIADAALLLFIFSPNAKLQIKMKDGSKLEYRYDQPLWKGIAPFWFFSRSSVAESGRQLGESFLYMKLLSASNSGPDRVSSNQTF